MQDPIRKKKKNQGDSECPLFYNFKYFGRF